MPEASPGFLDKGPLSTDVGTQPGDTVSIVTVERACTITAVASRLIAAMTAVMLSGCVQPLPSKLGSPSRTLSVCELSRNVAAYAGQILMVRGVYYHGLQQRCPQRCPTGEPWPSILDLWESKNSDYFRLRVPFATDEASWDSLDRAVLEAADKREKAEVWATVRGYLVVKLESPLGPCDLVANGMFGGLYARGWHGGALIVERIRDVEIRKNAATGYDYSFARRKTVPE